ncbi:MAG: hypothetical protein R2838_04280 [Caldilineaceae bacterium]
MKNFAGFDDNSYFVENVKSVSARDDHTVVFELNQPNSRFHTKFLIQLAHLDHAQAYL